MYMVEVDIKTLSNVFERRRITLHYIVCTSCFKLDTQHCSTLWAEHLFHRLKNFCSTFTHNLSQRQLQVYLMRNSRRDRLTSQSHFVLFVPQVNWCYSQTTDFQGENVTCSKITDSRSDSDTATAGSASDLDELRKSLWTVSMRGILLVWKVFASTDKSPLM